MQCLRCTHKCVIQNLTINFHIRIIMKTGASVVIPENLQEENKNRFAEHQFSVVANELMSMNRTMPDVRYPE